MHTAGGCLAQCLSAWSHRRGSGRPWHHPGASRNGIRSHQTMLPSLSWGHGLRDGQERKCVINNGKKISQEAANSAPSMSTGNMLIPAQLQPTLPYIQAKSLPSPDSKGSLSYLSPDSKRLLSPRQVWGFHFSSKQLSVTATVASRWPSPVITGRKGSLWPSGGWIQVAYNARQFSILPPKRQHPNGSSVDSENLHSGLNIIAFLSWKGGWHSFMYLLCVLKNCFSRVQWYTPIISALSEAEAGG